MLKLLEGVIMSDIGNRLKQLRESKKLSLYDLAQYLETSSDFVSQLENGEKKLTLTILNKLSALYCCDKAYLLCKSNDYSSVNFAFRSDNLSIEDLNCVASLNKLLLNIRLLNKINSED